MTMAAIERVLSRASGSASQEYWDLPLASSLSRCRSCRRVSPRVVCYGSPPSPRGVAHLRIFEIRTSFGTTSLAGALCGPLSIAPVRPTSKERALSGVWLCRERPPRETGPPGWSILWGAGRSSADRPPEARRPRGSPTDDGCTPILHAVESTPIRSRRASSLRTLRKI